MCSQMQAVMSICDNSDWVNMDSQSSNAIEVPDENMLSGWTIRRRNYFSKQVNDIY